MKDAFALAEQSPNEEATDALGWPPSFWELLGTLDDFDVGDRKQPHGSSRR